MNELPAPSATTNGSTVQLPPGVTVEALLDLVDQLERDEPEVRPADPSGKSQEELRDELFRNGSSFMATTREQIVGIDNILGEIDEIIHWLSHSRDYAVHGSRLQPGVVFAGSPGTGKTLVSRWIATASGATFINVRDFVHDDALYKDADIRDLFLRGRARYAATGRPVVLFWDEFENAATERSDRSATPEQRSGVSQLTAELDGIHGKNEGLLLIGCTNYLSSIDAALLRRGRMGVQIEFYPPDRRGKESILGYYLRDLNTEKGLDMPTLSYFFPRQNTAADIEEACVEAWRHAVRRAIDHGGRPYVSSDDLIKVFIKQLVGPPTTFIIPEEERLPIAIHESGHAIVALAYGVPLRLITVQPGKKSLGRVMVDDLEEYIGSVPEKINHMRLGLGGLAAERTAGLPPMIGAENDIRRVSGEAQYLVDTLTVGEETGIINICAMERTVGYANMIPQIGQSLLERSDADIHRLVETVEHDACRTTERVGQKNLLEIAHRVNEQVTLTGIEFRELFISVCGHAPEELIR